MCCVRVGDVVVKHKRCGKKEVRGSKGGSIPAAQKTDARHAERRRLTQGRRTQGRRTQGRRTHSTLQRAGR